MTHEDSVAAGPEAARLPAPRDRLRLRLYLAGLAGDAVLVPLSFGLAGLLYLGDFGSPYALPGGTLLLPLYLTIALYNGTYSLASLQSVPVALKRTAAALAISAALLNFVIFFAQAGTAVSRASFAIGLGIAALLLAVWRLALLTAVVPRLGPLRNIMIIDAGGPAFDLPGAIRIDAVELGLGPDVADPVALDRLGRQLRNMDSVIVSCRDDARLVWSQALKGSGADAEVVSGFVRQIGALGVAHYDAIGISTLAVSRGALGFRDRVAKRIFDLALVVPALLILLVPMAVISVLIRAGDGGPVFFRQRRVGRGNRFFSIFKFRTMRIENADADGTVSASREDARITRIGRLLRATSLDELPQLFNILAGHMSFVGPRPHALASHAGEKLFWEVDRRYWHRHALKPGLTGLAQVRGFRGATARESDLVARLQSDLEYCDGWSLWRDIVILLATLRVIVHRNAF